MADYIKREEAINAFDDPRVDRYYGDVSPSSVIDVIKTIPAADVRENVRGEWIVENLDDGYADGQRDSWISVEDALPHAEYGEGTNVLTIDTMGLQRVAEWNGGNWCWPTGEVIATCGKFPITHWMPLPKPPLVEVQ